MTNLKKLHNEFQSLKAEVFANGPFVAVEPDDEKQNRYSQLLAYFFPQFRTKNWINPEIMDNEIVAEYELYYS